MDSVDITRLLNEMKSGNREAEEQLIPHVYEELRRLAGSLMRKERPQHTLQTTALVHEAYIRLAGTHEFDWASRNHFFAVAARVMRRILVDMARARQAEKRDGALVKVQLDEVKLGSEESWDQILAVHEALARFAKIDERGARVVELRFFAGLTVDEVAQLLEVSDRTVKRDWEFAQAWLYTAMSSSPDPGP